MVICDPHQVGFTATTEGKPGVMADLVHRVILDSAKVVVTCPATQTDHTYLKSVTNGIDNTADIANTIAISGNSGSESSRIVLVEPCELTMS